VQEEAQSLIQNKVEETKANLDRLHERMKRRFAGPNKETLLQLIQDQKAHLVARGQRLLRSGEIDAVVAAAAAAPTPAEPIQDSFAASGQGCFDVTDTGSWQRLADEEAAQRLQMTFVTGKIPESGCVETTPAPPLSPPQAAFHHLVGHALYRNRITRSTAVQLVGDRAEEARRRILSIGGGYVAQLDCSALAFSQRQSHLSPEVRIVLVDLDRTSRRTATKALRRVLSQKDHPLVIATSARDQTPLVLPEGFKLLFLSASDVVNQVRHHILLPAAASSADCSKPEIPCSAEVRKSLLQRLLRGWLKTQQEDRGSQHHCTTPLKQVIEEILQIDDAKVYQSLAPTQRELSLLFEENSFPIVSHSNTLKVKLRMTEPDMLNMHQSAEEKSPKFWPLFSTNPDHRQPLGHLNLSYKLSTCATKVTILLTEPLRAGR